MRLREARWEATEAIFRHANIQTFTRSSDLETKRDGPRVLMRRSEQDDRRPVLLARERQFANELFCSLKVMHFDDDDVERARRRARHDDAGIHRTHDEEPREIDARAREAWRVQSGVRIHPRAPRAPRTTLRRRDG
jgi:hypothetical protein